MPRVFATVEILLHTGAKDEDLRKFIIEEASSLIPLPGLEFRLLKGERGDREGKYMVLMEYETVETRNRFSPHPDVVSDEVKRMPGSAAFMERWQSLIARSMYTDYVEVEKQ